MMLTRRHVNQCWLVPICLALVLGGLALPAPSVSAANTLHVTSCADDGGATTLRGQIAAAGVGGTIVFDQNCTITLTTGTLSLTQAVTIDGTGHTVIVDGGCTFSNGSCQSGGVTVFGVNSGVTASLSNLTVQHGAGTYVCFISVGVSFTCGGAIGNQGTLSVTNCTLTGNSNSNGIATHGGAIFNGGTLSVTNSTISANTSNVSGGGIWNNFAGTLSVTNSTITGNSAIFGGGGGGILSDGMLTVTNSTFSSNSAGAGGAIEIENGAPTITNSTISGNTAGIGGGIDVDTLGTLTVANSTISGNSGGKGGGIYTIGMVTVTNSTISGNTTGIGGGIDDEGNYNVTLTNTIVAGNTASTGSDLNRSIFKGGHFVSGGHNLIGKIEVFGFSGATFDQFGTTAFPLDPLLGTLGANGGPTQTIPLLSGSHAIAAADPAICANTSGTAPVAGKDQRGLARPTDLCAIGASEPLISIISPTFGLPSGGTTVTLTGAGAVPGVTVSIGGVHCTNVQIVNSTTLTCTAGSHASGMADVVVTVGSLSATVIGGYTYGSANGLPGAKPLGGVPGAQNPLPGARPAGTTGGVPNPLPPARP